MQMDAMTRAIAFIIALVLGATGALAQPTPPTPQYPCGRSTTACDQLIVRNNWAVWFPFWATFATKTSGYLANGSGGQAFLLAVELEDGFSAIQIGFANVNTAPYSIAEVAIAPSAKMGSSGAPGITPYDQINTTVNAMLPVTFANGGNISQPTPDQYSGMLYSAANQGQAEAVYPLVLSSASGSDLIFTTVTPDPMFGGYTSGVNAPQVGWYANDGLAAAGESECIPPNSTISAINTSTFHITVPGITAANCPANTVVWFSRGPLGPLQVTVPAAVNAPEMPVVWSDWIPVRSLLRTDSNLSGGNIFTLTGTGLSTNPATHVSSVSATSIAIDQPTTGNTNSQALTASYAATAPTAVPEGYIVPVSPSDAKYLAAGMKVTDSGGVIPSNTYVFQVCNGQKWCYNYTFGTGYYVRLINAVSGALSRGDTLTFSETIISQTSTVGATTLNVESPQSGRPLLLIRGFINGVPTIRGFNNNVSRSAHLNYGWADTLAYTGPESGGSAVDCVNFIASCANGNSGGASGITPVFAIRYLTDHEGIEMVTGGDSHMQGLTNPDDLYSPFVLAAWDLTQPNVFPVTIANVAIGGESCDVYCHEFWEMTKALQPNVAVLQSGTSNGDDSFNSKFDKFQGMRSTLRQTGARMVYWNNIMSQSLRQMNFVIASDVNASTTVPTTLVWGLAEGSLFTPGAGYGISSTNNNCLPLGTTTVTLTNLPGSIISPTLTTAAPITCPAGTILTLGNVSASIGSGSKAVTLATPAWNSNTVMVSGTGIASGSTLAMTAGSTSATLSINATQTGTTTLTLGSVALTPGVWQAQEFDAGLNAWIGGALQTTPVFDAFSETQDPANPGYLLPGLSADGKHLDECGVLFLARGACGGLKNSGPSVESLLSTMIGN